MRRFTVFTSNPVGPSSHLLIRRHAAATLATTYVSAMANGSFTITHTNNAQTDRIFGFACLG